MKVVPFVLAAVLAVAAIVLTMAMANSTASQHTVTVAASTGPFEGARDGDDLGCVTLLGLDYDLRCLLRRGRSGEGY